MREIALDKLIILWFIKSGKTVEAEIKSSAHPQRVPPQAESGMKSGAANGPRRAEGNAEGQSIF